jgi:hypothetical protein
MEDVARHDLINGKDQVVQQTETTNYISGLTSLTVHYSSKYNKRVYILGENHRRTQLCDQNATTADLFFFKLLDEANREKLLDVFIESDIDTTNDSPLLKFKSVYKYRSQELNPNRSGFMQSVTSKLNKMDCITDIFWTENETISCQAYRDHIRFHLGDIRNTNINIIKYLRVVFSGIFNVYNNGMYYPFSFDVLEKYGQTDANYNDPEKLKADLLDMLTTSKIAKQMSKIPEKYQAVKDKLNEKIDSYLDKMLPELTYDNVRDVVLKYTRTGKSYVSQKLYDSNRIFSHIMDLYLISRMFRTFRDVSGKLSGEPQNIIIYTGNSHSQNYRELFDELGFITEFKAERFNDNTNINCVDIYGFVPQWI